MTEPTKCLTCGGTGWIGGPSYYNPGEGGEPCPDCSHAAIPSPAPIEPAQAEPSDEAICRLADRLWEMGEINSLSKTTAIIYARAVLACFRPAPATSLPQTLDQKTERNIRVQARYDELMRIGARGHYETMFRVVREEVERALRPTPVAEPARGGGYDGVTTHPEFGCTEPAQQDTKGEPVAWWRISYIDPDVQIGKNKPTPQIMADNGFEWQPLYATPQSGKDTKDYRHIATAWYQGGVLEDLEGNPLADALPDGQYELYAAPQVLAARSANGAVAQEVERIIEGYAESYDTMSRNNAAGDGRVSCSMVAFDLRDNLIPQVLAARSGEGAVPEAVKRFSVLDGLAYANERVQAELLEALRDATAHLAGAASAYRTYAKRASHLGKVPVDALFTTRADDFDKAVERARTVLIAALSTGSEKP